MLGGLAGGGGLLGVVLLRVPVGGGGDEEEQHVDRHRGGGAVLPTAERRPAVDEVAGGLAQGPVVSALGLDVGAGGPLEHEGCLAQFCAGVGGGGLGERVQDLAGCRDVAQPPGRPRRDR